MRLKLLIFCLPFSIFCRFSSFSPIAAEIVNCNGNWTNKPCDGKILEKISETSNDEESFSSDSSEKKQIISNVNAHATELLRLGITFPAYEITKYCKQPSISVDDCRQNFKKLSDSFRLTVEDAQLRIRQQKEKALESSSSSSSVSSINSNGETSTTVTIINPNSDWRQRFPWRARHGYPFDQKRRFQRYPHRPENYNLNIPRPNNMRKETPKIFKGSGAIRMIVTPEQEQQPTR